jgi:pimeloyl-ACP methyl ester carboxylesterase
MNFTEQTLSTITARTLVVHGDRDRFFPVEIPVTMYRSIPVAALWIVPGGDHVPIYDSVVPFTSTALKFLDESASSNRRPNMSLQPIAISLRGASTAEFRR